MSHIISKGENWEVARKFFKRDIYTKLIEINLVFKMFYKDILQ